MLKVFELLSVGVMRSFKLNEFEMKSHYYTEDSRLKGSGGLIFNSEAFPFSFN